MRKRGRISCAKATSCTTDEWKRLRWMACRSMNWARMHSESPWSGRSTREFTPVQENSNEDDLAGLSVWLPDTSGRGAGCKPGGRSRTGGRRREHLGGGDLERGHYAGTTARGDTRGGSRTVGCPCGPDAESGATGVGF